MALIGTAAPALSGSADGTDIHARQDLAGLAGSARLRLRATGDALQARVLPPSRFAAFGQDLRQQGFDRSQPRGLTVRSFSVAPLLSWDDNINGGVLQDRFSLNGWIFEAAPETRARAGLVAGGSLRGGLRYVWDQGRSLALSGVTDLGWSPRHRLGRADAAIRLCSENQIRSWSFVDLCSLGQRAWRQRGVQSYHETSVTLRQILAAGPGLHELSLSAARASEDGSPAQTRLGLGVESLWPFGVTDLSATFGDAVPGATVLKRRVTAGLSLAPGGRPLRLELSHQTAAGGQFLGRPRSDRLTSAVVGLPLRAGITARLGLSRSRSSAVFANYSRATAEIRFNTLSRPF